MPDVAWLPPGGGEGHGRNFERSGGVAHLYPRIILIVNMWTCEHIQYFACEHIQYFACEHIAYIYI